MDSAVVRPEIPPGETHNETEEYETFAFVIANASYAAVLIACVYMLTQKRIWPPLQTKPLVLVLGNAVGGILWYYGFLVRLHCWR